MPMPSTFIRRLVVLLIAIFSASTTLSAQSSGTGWSYDSTSKTLTLSGSEVDWTAIKDFSTTTEHVLFAKDYAVSSLPKRRFIGFQN